MQDTPTSESNEAQPQRSLKRKRVSWAPDDQLVQVKLFRKDKTGRSSALINDAQHERIMALQMKKRQEEEWFEDRKKMAATMQWAFPRETESDPDFPPLAGPLSKQRDWQEEHVTGADFITIYFSDAQIPDTPKENYQEPLSIYMDSQIINIPFHNGKQTSDPPPLPEELSPSNMQPNNQNPQSNDPLSSLLSSITALGNLDPLLLTGLLSGLAPGLGGNMAPNNMTMGSLGAGGPMGQNMNLGNLGGNLGTMGNLNLNLGGGGPNMNMNNNMGNMGNLGGGGPNNMTMGGHNNMNNNMGNMGNMNRGPNNMGNFGNTNNGPNSGPQRRTQIFY